MSLSYHEKATANPEDSPNTGAHSVSADTMTDEKQSKEISHVDTFAPLGRNRSHPDREKGNELNREQSYHSVRSAPFSDPDARNDVAAEGGESGSKAFEVQWDGDDDPMNPRNMKTWRKWMITLTVSMSSLAVTMTSSLYTMTYEQLTPYFHCSKLVATLGLSLFVFGLGLSPMFLGPLSEFYGRRPIYVISFSVFFIWLIPCAVAQNLATMLIARFFDGLAGSAFLTVAGGTVGDMFDQRSLQLPMMIFTASPFIGPGLGPILGGFINSNVSWRWSFWVLMIFAAILLILVVVLVPETYHPVLLRKKARKLRAETGDDRYLAPIEIHKKSILQTVLRSLYRPFQLLIMEFMVASLCMFSAILLGILYLFFGAFDLVFSEVYDFTLWQVGLSFVGLLAGMIFAVVSDPFWHKNYNRLVRNLEKETGIPGASEPEFRLPPAIGGAPLTTIGLFIFAWTARPGIHWIAPMIGAGIFGCGTILVFSGIFTYLVQAFPLYAASALAANSFARSSFAAAFPLFGIQMYDTLGFPWASSLLAFLTLVMVPFPYIFFVYGKRLRQKSRFTSVAT